MCVCVRPFPLLLFGGLVGSINGYQSGSAAKVSRHPKH